MLSIATAHANDFMRKLFLHCIGINGCVTDVERVWANGEGLGTPSLFEEWLMLPFITEEIKKRTKQAERNRQLLW